MLDVNSGKIFRKFTAVKNSKMFSISRVIFNKYGATIEIKQNSEKDKSEINITDNNVDVEYQVNKIMYDASTDQMLAFGEKTSCLYIINLNSLPLDPEKDEFFSPMIKKYKLPILGVKSVIILNSDNRKQLSELIYKFAIVSNNIANLISNFLSF